MHLADYYLARRRRLFEAMSPDWALVTDPANVTYFSGFAPSPFVFNSQQATAALLLGRAGESILVADNVQQAAAAAAHVGERVLPVWYRCVESAPHRQSLCAQAAIDRLALVDSNALAYEASACPAAIVDGLRQQRPARPFVDIDETVRRQRRCKDAHEVELIRQSLAAATAALHAAMEQLLPGMSELDAYRLVQRVAGEAAGRQILLYGDFVSGPRCEQGGGPPSQRVVEAGDLVLLDFSVVIDGYRGDFCNTFVCGGKPTSDQRRMFDACMAALHAGEKLLRAGVGCRNVYAKVRDTLAEHGLADRFPHHAGHGIGLSHPEPPYIVPESAETLASGDVVTLEPGVYIPGVGGLRYERNYVILDSGAESLSQHRLCLEAT